MGRSFLLGNSGYLGNDKRGEYSSTGTTGNVSVRKHFLERSRGNFSPIGECPFGFSSTGILYQMDWENFTSNDWTTTIDGDHRWVVSSIDSSSGTTAGLVVDDNLNSYTYIDNIDVHMHVSLFIPSEVTNITIDFDWKCSGETAGATSYDYGYFWITDTGDTITSVARESVDDLAKRLGGDDSVSSSAVFYRKYNYDYVPGLQWNTEPTINLTGDTTQSGGVVGTFVAGEFNKFVWSFTSDTSVIDDPPFGVDNIVFRYTSNTPICVDPDGTGPYS